jgi:WD40 repeat protein
LLRLGTVRLRHGGTYGGFVHFSKDGKTLICSSNDAVIHFWDRATGRQLRRIKTVSYSGVPIAISPDEKLVAVGNSDFTIGLWSLTAGKEIRRFGALASSQSKPTPMAVRRF